MSDPHYEDPRLVALYDLDNPWSADTDFYLGLSGACDGSGQRPAKRILDLGCGTGLLTCAFAAQGHDALGVDPASTMLSAARSGAPKRLQSARARLAQQPGAAAKRMPRTGAVQWQPGNAQDFEGSDTGR